MVVSRTGCLFAAVGLAAIFAAPAPAQIIRTAPDIKNPPNYQPGTGVDRNGIKSNSSPRRTTNYVVPGGGYYYGWSPGGRYYYSDNYYYSDRYLCPYCGGRWCNGGCRFRGPIYYPPVVGDAGALYGPRAVRQFLGENNADNNANNAGAAQPIRVARAPAVPPPLSNPTVRARAWKFVEYGDRHFKRGDYRKAAARYRKAESQANDIPDVHFRQAFAELGAERYAEAVAAVKQGLALKPDWPDSGFVLEELYPTADAKRAVFRQLHTYVDQHPNDADGQFLLGMLQHFDGQHEAAEVRLRRVVELTGVGNHARAFLPPAPQQAQLPEAPAPLDNAPLNNAPLIPPPPVADP